jgi:branched-chain amino acid aminotransferase
LARSWGIRVEEKKVAVREVVDALKKGKVQEAFGVGTAATIARIESIGFEDQDYKLPDPERAQLAGRIYEELEGIKHGTIPDPFGWIVKM